MSVPLQDEAEYQVAISKSGSEVKIQCETEDDANAIYNWLEGIGDDDRDNGIVLLV